ncbi:MAG: hypothetical protein LBT53_07280 [Puniceicoccales bacterium]|jgi:hypothetical protein|nr:hypothetical protein [Puniceicoccales bacterium]
MSQTSAASSPAASVSPPRVFAPSRENFVRVPIAASNTYEPNRDVLTSKQNRITVGASANTIASQYDYTVNSIGQRTARSQSGTAFVATSTDAFSHNPRIEVTGSTNNQTSANNRAYSYDPIGNRLNATKGLSATPAVAKIYTSSSLNQYTTEDNGAIVHGNPAADWPEGYSTGGAACYNTEVWCSQCKKEGKSFGPENVQKDAKSGVSKSSFSMGALLLILMMAVGSGCSSQSDSPGKTINQKTVFQQCFGKQFHVSGSLVRYCNPNGGGTDAYFLVKSVNGLLLDEPKEVFVNFLYTPVSVFLKEYTQKDFGFLCYETILMDKGDVKNILKFIAFKAEPDSKNSFAAETVTGLKFLEDFHAEGVLYNGDHKSYVPHYLIISKINGQNVKKIKIGILAKNVENLMKVGRIPEGTTVKIKAREEIFSEGVQLGANYSPDDMLQYSFFRFYQGVNILEITPLQ